MSWLFCVVGTTLQAEDLDALKAKVQALSTASMKIGETLSQGGGGGSSGGKCRTLPLWHTR